MSAVQQRSPSQQEKRESSADCPLQGLGHRSQAWILFPLAKAFTVVLHHVGSLIHLSRQLLAGKNGMQGFSLKHLLMVSAQLQDKLLRRYFC